MNTVRDYFGGLERTADTLGTISQKELAGTPLSTDEIRFLKSMMVMSAMCGDPYSGWYPDLYYAMDFVPGDNADKTDFVVADVHTAPTDAAGNITGWVMHAGTGPVDMAVISADLPGTGPCAFVGPVMNFYGKQAPSVGYQDIRTIIMYSCMFSEGALEKMSSGNFRVGYGRVQTGQPGQHRRACACS